MSEEKIFGEIEGIFGWIKTKRQEQKNGAVEEEDMSAQQQLHEFFDFIGLQTSEEEIRALNELALYKREENEKKNLDSTKNRSDFANEPLSHQDFLRLFVADEKIIEKEKKDMLMSFRTLAKENNEEYIDLGRMREMLKLYEKDYKEETIDEVLMELENAHKEQEQEQQSLFNYKDYVDGMFRQRKN